MAVCGLSSMLFVSPIRPDMDSCPSPSLGGVTHNHLNFWQLPSNEARASSCFSSTMVDHNDRDDSGLSQTPSRTPSESKYLVTPRDSGPLPHHELELSISSLNDAQRTVQPSIPQTNLRSQVKEENFDPKSANTGTRDDTFTIGGSGGGEEETSFSGPPRKRARMSTLGMNLEENQTGNVREQLQLPRHSSLSVFSTGGSDVTGLHSLIPTRSLPGSLTRSTEREPPDSPAGASRGVPVSGGSSKHTTSWWLSATASVPGTAMPDSTQHSFPPGQESGAHANYPGEGRGMMIIPGPNSMQERDFMFKQPSYYPNMLSSMETEHVRRSAEEAHAPSVLARTPPPPQEQAPRPQSAPDHHHHPPEHHFFSRPKGVSTGRASSASSASEETVPRSGTHFFTKSSREAAASLQSEGVSAYGQQFQQAFEGGSRRRPHPSASESQHTGSGAFEREHHPQGGFARPNEQRALEGPPGVNANMDYYNLIRDVAQPSSHSQAAEFAAAAAAAAFNPSGIGFNLQTGQSLGPPSRRSSQIGIIGVGPVHFGGEAANNRNLVQAQQVPANDIRNLFATINSASPYMTHVQQQQTPDHRARSSRLPSNVLSIDFLPSLPRQQPGIPPASDRYRQQQLQQRGGVVQWSHPPHAQQDFGQIGAQPPLQVQQHFPAELNLSFVLRGTNSQPGLQAGPSSSSFREFLPGPQGPSSSSGLGRGASTIGPHGYPSADLHTNLSLQAPQEAPQPLTVVMEERSIGRRISLQDYGGYDSFADAMRAMVEHHVTSSEESRSHHHGENCTLANAVPGYVIAYEDDEGDVLVAGDLPWRDFVRMAKQIRLVSTSKIRFTPPTGPFREQQ